MIVLNEKMFAEECLQNGLCGEKPEFVLSILAKYYYFCKHIKKRHIYPLLLDFMRTNDPNFLTNTEWWNSVIERILAKVHTKTLYEISGVSIKRSEMETIQSLHSPILERLMFTMLCIAKWGNAKNAANNNWVYVDDKTIFQLARIPCSQRDRRVRIGDLYRAGLLEFAKRIDNLNTRVTFVQESGGEEVLFVEDFRELGNEYRVFNGDQSYFRCAECLRLTKRVTHNQMYCKDCSGYIPKVQKVVICEDCGKAFSVSAKASKTVKCKECKKKYDQIYHRDYMRRRLGID